MPALSFTTSAAGDAGYSVSSLDAKAQSVSFSFDPGNKLRAASANATVVVESADDAPLLSDSQLSWTEIARVQWQGGANPGPFYTGGAILVPAVALRLDMLKGKRLRWRSLSDNVGLSSAAIGTF